MRLPYFCFSFLLLSLSIVRGQTVSSQPSDNSQLPGPVAQAIALYQKTTGEHSHLYNGWEYVEYDIHIKDHQFFETDYSEEGTVDYDGMVYTQVPMLYDLVKDQLVIEPYNTANRLILIVDKVKSFTFLGQTFVRLQADSSRNNPIQTGFYHQLYNGQVKAYAKRVKLIEEEVVQMNLNRFFVQKNFYYIWKDGRYHAVKSKSSVMKLFEDRKKELGKVWRESKMRYRQNREAAIVKLVSTYDELRSR